MASGALPPAFPAVRVNGKLYWDGGILSNTPTEVVLDDNPRRDSLIFAVHLWNPVGATLDIHDVGRQPEFPDDCKGYHSEGLVDFDTLDVAVAPAGARQRLFDSGDRPEAEQTRLDRSDAVRHETRDGRQATSICTSFARQ
jgi:predicted acylesterase/phospholipase RssA